MSVIPFSDGDKVPPRRRQKKFDLIIDAIFQVLPAASVKEIHERLLATELARKIAIKENIVRGAIAHLRKNSRIYQWTIPHVPTHPSYEGKYFAIMINKDESFSSDPGYIEKFTDGTTGIIRRILTESMNHSMMCKAAAASKNISRPLRTSFEDLAEDAHTLASKARRVLRNLESNQG